MVEKVKITPSGGEDADHGVNEQPQTDVEEIRMPGPEGRICGLPLKSTCCPMLPMQGRIDKTGRNATSDPSCLRGDEAWLRQHALSHHAGLAGRLFFTRRTAEGPKTRGSRAAARGWADNSAAFGDALFGHRADGRPDAIRLGDVHAENQILHPYRLLTDARRARRQRPHA